MRRIGSAYSGVAALGLLDGCIDGFALDCALNDVVALERR